MKHSSSSEGEASSPFLEWMFHLFLSLPVLLILFASEFGFCLWDLDHLVDLIVHYSGPLIPETLFTNLSVTLDLGIGLHVKKGHLLLTYSLLNKIMFSKNYGREKTYIVENHYLRKWLWHYMKNILVINSFGISLFLSWLFVIRTEENICVIISVILNENKKVNLYNYNNMPYTLLLGATISFIRGTTLFISVEFAILFSLFFFLVILCLVAKLRSFKESEFYNSFEVLLNMIMISYL